MRSFAGRQTHDREAAAGRAQSTLRGRAAAAPAAPRALQPKLAAGRQDGADERGLGAPRGAAPPEARPLRERPGRAAELPEGAAAAVERAIAGAGRPLEPGLRRDMERRLGHDFGQVRVHADGEAAESARAVGARAYTVGRAIVFGPGGYAPGTREGRRLLAHELAHVAQQAGPSGAAAAPSGALGPGAALQRAPGGGAPPPAEPLEAIAERIARLALGPNQAAVRGLLRGPVLTVVRDTLTGRIYVGLNTGIPPDLSQVVDEAIAAQRGRIARGEVVVVRSDPRAVGGHSEVNALNRAVRAREALVGRRLTEAELKVFELHNVWLSGRDRRLTVAPRCEHCARIARGVSVTQSLFVAEGGVVGEVEVPQRGAVTPAGSAQARPATTASGTIEPRAGAPPAGSPQVRAAPSGGGAPGAGGLRLRGALRLGAGLGLQTALFWFLSKKAGEAEERSRAALFEQRVAPEVARRQAELAPQAVRLTSEDPASPVYANVTADFDLTWTESGIAGTPSAEHVTDIRFVAMTLSREKLQRQQQLSKESSGWGQVKTLYATRRVTYSFRVEFEESEAEHRWRVLLHHAGEVARRGMAARAVGEHSHWGGKELTPHERWEDEQRRRWGDPTLEEQRAYDERELWVLAYIHHTAFHGPDEQYADALRYLEEIRRRPRPVPRKPLVFPRR